MTPYGHKFESEFAWTPFLSASLMQAQLSTQARNTNVLKCGVFILWISIIIMATFFCNNTQSSDITKTHKTQSGALAPLLLEPSFPRSAHHLGTKVTCLTA